MQQLRLFVVLFFSTLVSALAQRVGVYTFENSFAEASNKFPMLRLLGRPGDFVEEKIAELDNQKRFVYAFDKNCGLQFDNRAANGFFDESYTIEMYFRFAELDSWKRVVDFKNRKTDNGCYVYDGKLNFYNYAVGEKAPVRPNKYTHYVVSRNAKTKQVKMYVDGLSKIEFTDKLDEGKVDEDGLLNFFYDDLMVKDEASEGAIALLKIYDYVIEPQNVRRNFSEIREAVLNPAMSLPSVSVASPLAVEVPKSEPPKIENKPLKWAGKIQNALNKQPIKQALLLVLDSNMVEIKREAIVDGTFNLLLMANQEHNLAVESLGFFPVALQLSPAELANRSRYDNIFVLEPVEIGKHIVLKNLRFAQSKAELLPESDAELNRLLIFLRDNLTIKIELEGHTDNQGDFNLNLALSKQRVEAVKAFLTSKGINAKRISGHGFGASRPVANNNREETRKLNRRVELVITEY